MSKGKDSLGDRMKGYENVARHYLVKRCPVIIRVDGAHFHTLTKNMEKPFDAVLIKSMQDTMKYLCEHIAGCVFGYTQSDEITLILTDYKTTTTAAWFDYCLPKLCSTSAAMATLAFNRAYIQNANDLADGVMKATGDAMFDARCFNVPVDDVCNCLIWRQQDAIRNSIESVGQANFKHSELMNKNCDEIKRMLRQIGKDWDSFDDVCKRGSACYRKKENAEMQHPITGETISVTRNPWIVDKNIPIFSKERNYIERWIV